MTRIAAVAVALSMVFTPVAFAKAPKTKAACEKAKMVWDDAAKTCSKAPAAEK
jgi:hypothetical protein